MPGSSTIIVDNGLNIQGAAADAKKTGDEIASLKGDLGQKADIKIPTTSSSDLDITDSVGNVIARFENGHIKTKEFDSSNQTDIVQKIWTGSCSTGQGTATKVVNLDKSDGFNLANGVTIAVYFSNRNDNTDPKLNVNGTGAVNVKYSTHSAEYAMSDPYCRWGCGIKFFTYKDGAWILAFGEMADLAYTIATRAPLTSPVFTGTPTAPTATAGTNTTQIATTAFVQNAVQSGATPDIIRTAADSTADLDIADYYGNVIVRFENGHIKTKEFDSSNIIYQPFYGKKWTVVGDSLTEVNVRTTLHYHDYIAESTGITVVNHGHSGAGYYARSFDYAFMNEVKRIPTDSDIITIFGSINDVFHTTIPLGNITDTTTDTLCGCINITLDNLYARIPAAYLGIITPTPCWYQSSGVIDDWTPSNPGNDLELYSGALVEICKRRSIPCLDLYHSSNLRPQESSFRTLAFSKDSGNGIHPNETGHKLIAARFLEFIKTLILYQ